MAVAPPPNVMLNLSVNMSKTDARDLFLFLANRKMGRERGSNLPGVAVDAARAAGGKS